MECNPPDTCFRCPYPDCINSAMPSPAENALAHDLSPRGRRKKVHKAYYRALKAKGICPSCRKPLTEADGDHVQCASCRKKDAERHRRLYKKKKAER